MSDRNLPTWYIYGAGGLGIETADILLEAMAAGSMSPHKVIFLVDEPKSENLNSIPIVKFDESISGSKVTVAIGEPAHRKSLAAKAVKNGLVLSSVISPKAFVSKSATIGAGSVVAPFASIQSMATVGKNASINTQAIVGHHVVIGEGVVVSSQANIGGNSSVEASAYIGMGAVIKEKICIGPWAIIGMGSVVHQNLPAEIIALGNPARVAKKNTNRKVFN